jgi:hypothetical protein
MLFPYQYVPHKIEKMQEFIDFIFYDVWCKATSSRPFSPDLFNGNSDLKDVMTIFNYDHKKGGDFFYSHVERIYGHFAGLTQPEIAQFKQWYQGNNAIEKVCANDPAVQITRYVDIRTIHCALCDELAKFFKGLYSKDVLALAVLKQKIGDIDDHYQNFMAVNTNGKCPFCGIADMQGVYHTKREAYDHYLPKAVYPFNSINFKNLVPACHHCNSTYKSSQDPAYTPKDPSGAVTRRKIFYPYTTTGYNIEIRIDLRNNDVDNLTPSDITLQFGPAALTEEIDTWKDVYGIEERYRAKLLGGDGKAWLVEVFDEWRWHDKSGGDEGKAPDEYLRDLDRHASRSPYANSNFLKKAFLEGCGHAGLFTAIV